MRTKVNISKEVFEAALQEADSKGLANHGAVLHETAMIYNKNRPAGKNEDGRDIFPAISYQIVHLRLKDGWGTITTEMGKRGRESLSAEEKQARAEIAADTARRSRADLVQSPECKESFDTIRAELKAKGFANLTGFLSKMEKGSLTAAVALKCRECCGYGNPTVCDNKVCPLWSFRPGSVASESES